MGNQDIRWHQRLANYKRALKQLQDAVELSHNRDLSDLEEQGMIQAFEFTHELAWNLMKDYFEYQGNTTITGSRDATREAFNKGLIENGDSWMDMIKSRNRSTHTYNESTAKEIANLISEYYTPLFKIFEHKMESIRSGTQQNIFDKEI